MTLHQQIQILTSVPDSDRAGAFRFKALLCEQRASETADPKSKQDWAELAIDWHAMAHFITRTEGQSEEYEWTQGR